MAKHKPSKSRHKQEEPLLAGKNQKLALGIAAVVTVIIAVAIAWGATRPDINAPRKVSIDTAKGLIVVEVYPELMPVTVENFRKLVKSGFYDGLTFHRVEDWVIQGGDPEGTGQGGPGWTIPFETNRKLKNVRGAVAMARGDDPNSAGSQFYILKKDAQSLDGQYAVFGKVVKGMEVVDKIKPGDKMVSVRE